MPVTANIVLIGSGGHALSCAMVSRLFKGPPLAWEPWSLNPSRNPVDIESARFLKSIGVDLWGTSKNPYFIFGLIFFLAATLSKCTLSPATLRFCRPPWRIFRETLDE